MWEKIVARIETAPGTVRIGEVNQDATGESVTQRGLGFIDRIIELAAEKGWKVAVIGNEFYVNGVKGERPPKPTPRSSSRRRCPPSPPWSCARTKLPCC